MNRMASLCHELIFLVVCLFHSYHATGDVVYTSCQVGWLAGRGSCYLFDPDLKTYELAKVFCQAHGGHLVRVDDTAENELLKNFLQLFRSGHFRDWWIGLSDGDEEGVWRWEDDGDGSSSNIFTDWFPGQPDNYSNQDCTMFNHNYNYKWTDDNCAKNHNSICEIRDHSLDITTSVIG